MKGKWAEGIRPRNFAWVITGRLAVCERPGGNGANHRRVRRQEEIIWLRQQDFDLVVSLINAPHNLHNYEELGLPYLHRPFPPVDDVLGAQVALYRELRDQLAEGRRVVIHGEEVGDMITGLMAGYMVWTGMVPEQPRAVAFTERIFERPLGSRAREYVVAAANLVGHA
jgi:hypothetical protein